MKKRILVYDWEIVARDEDFRKYRKVLLVDLDVDGLETPHIGTELSFTSRNKARVTKHEVDFAKGETIIYAVALNKWVL